MNDARERKPRQVFLSPIQVLCGQNNRVTCCTFSMLQAGSPPKVMTYATKALAREARLALLEAKNVHPIGSNGLWEAIEKALSEAVTG